MSRNKRAEWAQETLSIIENGNYIAEDTIINIQADILNAIDGAELHSPESLSLLRDNLNIVPLFDTEIIVENTTVLKAATKLANENKKIGCLNFASAKNPGGGFLGRAMAQEESIAVSSSLYPTLTKHFEMYEYNRQRPTLLYSDYMIYSPDIVVFRDDEGCLLADPFMMSVVTSPAVNVGAIINNRPYESEAIHAVMMERMDKMFALFLSKGIEHLLLGAWGCGVFRNDPKDIAGYFASYIKAGGKYHNCFKSIVFAVLDKSKEMQNIKAFEEVLLK